MMDDDFALETDEINDFLQNKLNEIKSINCQLEESLAYRNGIKSKCHQQTCGGNLQVSEGWKRIANEKYVLGYKIARSVSGIQHINVVLNWDSLSPLNYRFSQTSGTGPLTGNDEHILVVTMDLPVFLKQQHYTISGLVICQIGLKEKMQAQLPPIRLCSEDFTDNTKLIQMYRVIDGCLEDFIACVYSCDKYEFDLVYPDGQNGSRLLSTLFELDCSFSKVNIGEGKRFFLVHKISPLFDGSVLEIDDVQQDHCTLDIYYRNKDSLFALIHYLHRHLINASIVPKGAYRPHLTLGENCELLKKSVYEEIGCTNQLLGQSATTASLFECKRMLAALESRTDFLVARVNSHFQLESNSIDFY